MSSTISIESGELIDDIESSFRVTAGPGAGKTYWLAGHITNVLRNSDKIKGPSKIACISFTNIAVETITKMIEERLGRPTNKVHVSTIHSFLYQFVVKPYLHLIHETSTGEPLVDYRLVDGHDEHFPNTSIIKEWLKRNGRREALYYKNKKEWDKYFSALQWKLDEQSQWSLTAKRVNPKYFPARNLANYKDGYWKEGIIDHEDVLYFAHRILDENPLIRKMMAVKFPYLFIDEFQDTNTVQTQVVRWLAENKTVVGIIGDPQQSIYGFRNAKAEDFDSFSVPNLKDYVIENNRRSTENIINLINLSRRDQLKQQKIEDNYSKEVITFLVGNLEWGVPKFKELSGFPQSGSAIISRKKKDVRSIRCIEKGVTINTDVDFNELRSKRKILVSNLIEAMIASKEGRYGPALSSCIKALRVNKEGEFKDPITCKKPVTEFERRAIAMYLLSWSSEYLQKVDETTLLNFYQDLVLKLDERFNGMKLSKITSGNPKKFAESYTLANLMDSITSSEDRRIIRTIHKAKGDEFNKLLVYFEKEFRIDHILPNDRKSEEQRITYVAISRAKQHLFILTPSINDKQIEGLLSNGVAHELIFEGK